MVIFTLLRAISTNNIKLVQLFVNYAEENRIVLDINKKKMIMEIIHLSMPHI